MGRIIYAKAKMSGNGMKMMTYTGKGAFGTIEPSTLNRFMGNGINHGVIPFVGEGVSERPKNISQRVRKML